MSSFYALSSIDKFLMRQIYVWLVCITPQNGDDFHDSIHMQYDSNHYHEKLIE